MRSSVKIRSIAAAILLASAYCCFYWAYGHGGFSRMVRIPIEIVQGQSVDIRFSVAEAGVHNVMIAYPKGTVDYMGKTLRAVTGEAVVGSGGRVVAEAELPVDHQRSTRDFDAMVLFTLATEPFKEYTVTLEVTHLPSALTAAQPAIQVEVDPHYMFTVWQVELLGLLLSLAAILFGIPLIRRRTKKLKSDISNR